MSSRQQSKVVFVGNIPYGLTEEQIIDTFSSVGRVVNFRLVYDRETGRPKGFGFAEFPDYDSAASAVRNLDDHEIMGRKLRVDFSNEPAGGDDESRDRTGGNPSNAPYSQPSNGSSSLPAPPTGSSSLPPLPQGKELPPGMTCTDVISQTLNTLTSTQLLDALQQVQTLATQDPARLTELFNQAPQLTYAIFQAMLLMGLVSPDAINSVLDTPGAAAAPPPAAAPAPYSYPGATGTPPVAVGGGYAPPPAVVPSPVPVAAPAPPAAAAPQTQDPEALMRAVMELPQEMIDQLPEAERQQILMLRATYGMQQQQRR